MRLKLTQHCELTILQFLTNHPKQQKFINSKKYVYRYRSMQRNRAKQWNGKDQKSFQENQRYQGSISCKDGLNKGRKCTDLTEAEDIKKRQQEYTEELYKKDLHDPDNHNGVITDLAPDILECEVKWALESITTNKVSGGDGIPIDLFQILKENTQGGLFFFFKP